MSPKKSRVSEGPALRGRALEAAVKAAEAPVLGEAVKRAFFAQLGLDALLSLKLPDGPRRACVIAAPLVGESQDESGG